MINSETPEDTLEIFAAIRRASNALVQKNYPMAEKIYRQLIRLDYTNAAVWCNLSIALREQGYRAAALLCAQRAIELEPKITHQFNLSDCLLATNRLTEALDILSEIVQAVPDNLSYRVSYADTLRQCHRFEEALEQVNHILTIQPNDVETIWQCAMLRLKLGQFKKAWVDYEVRWKKLDTLKQSYDAPRWTGQDLNGKTILLYEEQGFGDTILATRYIPLVKERGARVIFGCKTVLHKLFADIPGIDRLSGGGALGEYFDYHAPLFSLPGIFGTEINTIPSPVKLCTSQILSPEISALLASGEDRFRVGVVWSGSATFGDNYRRSAPFAHFLQLAEIPGVQLYSLQKGDAEKELALAQAEGLVPQLGTYLTDFADTAAVLDELDLVIMTDSSVAHLAGSLDVPVWNLLCYNAFWLYMTARVDSPWYPSMRLFRQPVPGDWGSVFTEVAASLRKTVAETMPQFA